jgi:crotonobetainyl-CoA:carnitine CoA-transferase CaiB-like acyl-CoA transferase
MAERSDYPFASNWMEAPYGIYRTADHFIAIAHARLPVLSEVFGDPRIAEAAQAAPPFENAEARRAFRDRIGALVAESFAKKTTQAWVDELTPRDIWVGPVLTYAELVEHPQAQHLFVSVDHPAGPYKTLACAVQYAGAPPIRRGPRFGEHTDEVLAEAGFSVDVRAAMRECGSIR